MIFFIIPIVMSSNPPLMDISRLTPHRRIHHNKLSVRTMTTWKHLEVSKVISARALNAQAITVCVYSSSFIYTCFIVMYHTQCSSQYIYPL